MRDGVPAKSGPTARGSLSRRFSLSLGTTPGPTTSLLPGLVLLVSPNAGDNPSAADSSGSGSLADRRETLRELHSNPNSNPVRPRHETTVSQGATHPPSI